MTALSERDEGRHAKFLGQMFQRRLLGTLNKVTPPVNVWGFNDCLRVA